MRSKISICVWAAALLWVLGASPVPAPCQEARAVLAGAAKAMGAEGLKTLEYSGMGSSAVVGQSRSPSSAWPISRLSAYTRQIDFAAGSSRAGNQNISAGSPWDTQFEFWLNPFGFLKGALANNASLTTATIDGAPYNVVTFSLANKYKVTGYINNRNRIERIQTWIDNDLLGDMPAEAWFSEYKDFDGVSFPAMIVEKQGGFPVLILSVANVKANAPVAIPAAEAPPAPAALPVQSEKIAEGVFYLRGGTHHSVAVEFADYAVVIEAPLNEQRSLAVIAEVKRLVPNKPIRYLVNTHHHFDHAGGLRTYVDEGAIIVAPAVDAGLYRKAFLAPRTLRPDKLAQSHKQATIETVGDKKILSDGTRSLELHLIAGSRHSDGMLMALLSRERILIEADVYTPASPAASQKAAVNQNTVNLVDNLERLKLDFETILPLHGPGAVTRSDLYAAIHKPLPDLSRIPAPAPAQNGQAVSEQAIDAAQLLEKACSGCHSLNRIRSQNLSQAEWRSVVDRMKEKGAEMSAGEMGVLVDYLVGSYGHK